MTREREVLARLVDGLPKCDLCARPATKAWRRGEGRWCDSHAFGTGYSERCEPLTAPDSPRAAPLREAMALLAEPVAPPPGRRPAAPGHCARCDGVGLVVSHAWTCPGCGGHYDGHDWTPGPGVPADVLRVLTEPSDQPPPTAGEVARVLERARAARNAAERAARGSRTVLGCRQMGREPPGVTPPAPEAPLATREVFLDCTNWRGQRRVRRVEPSDIVYAATEWHPAPQWLLCALDLEKRQMRSFALAGIHGFSTELPPAPPAPEAAPDEATLVEWERVTSEATPGPWWPSPGDDLGLEVMAGEPARPQATREERKGQTSIACTHGSEANQVFIALARSAMPKLIAALRQTRAELADDVPLDAAQVEAAVRETGIDPGRLVARIQARVEEAQLAEWERLAAEASPGPWYPFCELVRERDMAYVVAACNALPKLIAALRQARAAEQTWRVSTEGALAMLKTAQRERDEALSGDAYDGMARKLADRTEDVLRAEEALRQARAERVAMGERAVDEGRLLQARLAYAQTDRDEARAEATAAEGVIEAAQDAARALREHDHACADQDEPTRRRTCAACVGERLSRALTAHGGRRG